MWQSPPESIVLNPGEVHIWRSPLQGQPGADSGFWSSLSEDEKNRANRFHFRQHRLEYIDGRGKLRHLLGQYLQIAPQDIVFDYGKQQKPFIRGSKLQFNISHSHGLALFAFGLEMEIGVDLEKMSTEIDILELCQQFFAPKEAQTILALSGLSQIEAFYTCWTRKEAFIKAKGQGLSLPLDQFEVSILPEVPARLLATQWDSREADQWFLYPLAPEKHFLGALAVNRSIEALKTWDF